MAAPKNKSSRTPAQCGDDGSSTSLARVLRDFQHLVLALETGLSRSLEDTSGAAASRSADDDGKRGEHIRHEARRLAMAELGTQYTRKQMRRSLQAAEATGRRVEERLLAAADGACASDEEQLWSVDNGYFRLYSSELFDMLGQPTDLRYGTLRFHRSASDARGCEAEADAVVVELALGSSYFVADSEDTLPYHTFKMPLAPSLRNRGILSKRPEDAGAFPDYDSWLLFTFLGHGCLKLEIPVEMCADVYGGALRGREDEEVHFWGLFVADEHL